MKEIFTYIAKNITWHQIILGTAVLVAIKALYDNNDDAIINNLDLSDKIKTNPNIPLF